MNSIPVNLSTMTMIHCFQEVLDFLKKENHMNDFIMWSAYESAGAAAIDNAEADVKLEYMTAVEGATEQSKKVAEAIDTLFPPETYVPHAHARIAFIGKEES